MTENLKQHFPYPDNPLNEGRASLNDPQNSEIIAAEAAMLDGTTVSTEPIRRFTAPRNTRGEGDIVDQETEVFKIPTTSESLRADEVGKIDYRELRRRLGSNPVEQQIARPAEGPMHIDGRIPGQVPSTNARPHIPAGAKPSKLAEMHKRYNAER